MSTRLLLLRPYFLAAVVITFFGCGVTASVMRLLKPRRQRLFLAASATALVLLLLVARISDVGTARGICGGGLFYGSHYGVLAVLKVIVPIALFSGLIALIQG